LLDPTGKRSHQVPIAFDEQFLADHVAPQRVAEIDRDKIDDLAMHDDVHGITGIFHANVDIRALEQQP